MMSNISRKNNVWRSSNIYKILKVFVAHDGLYFHIWHAYAMIKYYYSKISLVIRRDFASE